MMILYIGPGVGAATIFVVVVVILIILISLAVVLWRPIKKFFKKFKS